MYLPDFSIQTHYFLYSILLGITVGLIYDMLRGLREAVYVRKKPKFYLSDVIIFIISAFLFEVYTITYGYGKIRYYALAGSLIGFIFYMNTLGSISFKIEKKIAEFLHNMLLFFVVKPLLLLYNGFVKLIHRLAETRRPKQRKGDDSGEKESSEEASEE